MRICGKRASRFTQGELLVMQRRKTGPDGVKLTDGQLKEIRKTYKLRKGGKTWDQHLKKSLRR